MSFNSRKQFEERIATLGKETEGLNADVENLTKALQLHHELLAKDRNSARGILKKEIGGSVWEYGAEGKLRDYKSSKYADDAAKLPPKPSSASGKKSGVKSIHVHSRHKTVNGTSKDKLTKEKRQKDIKASSSIEPTIRKPSCTQQRRPLSKGTDGKCQASNGMNYKNHRPLLSDSDEDAEVIASRYSHLQVSLNETYTKDASGDSPYQLPVAPEKPIPVPSDISVSAPDKRSKVLKKMIKKLDIDLKLGEYKTSETDSDSISTPQPTKSDHSAKPARYCDPDVLAWLLNQGLKDTEKYARIFSEHNISMTDLVSLNENRLRQMGITSSSTLAKLTNAIQDLKKPPIKGGPKQSMVAVAHSVTPKDGREKKTPAIHIQQQQLPKQQKTKTPDSADRRIQKGCEKSCLKSNDLEPHSSSGPRQNQVSSSRPCKNSVKSVLKSKKAVVQHRPQSAVVSNTKPVIKHGSKVRPTSASPSKVEKDMTSASSEGGAPVIRQKECVLNKEATLSSLIAIRPLTRNLSHSLKTDEISQQHDLSNGDRSNNEAEVRLQIIEQQIHELQKELTSPAALNIISNLQTQLQEIQNEVLMKKKNTTEANIQNGVGTRLESIHLPRASSERSSLTECTDLKLGECQRILDSFHDVDPTLALAKETKQSPTTDFSKTKNLNSKPLSVSLSKTELLREVRKQNDAHRKHIRHLESELSRLKYKDPMRNCEIPEKDIHYSQQDLLGEGAFSQVFRGTYQGSEVAVKRLKVPLSSQDKNYFTAEVSLLRELRHPRVVLLVGVCTTSQHPLMVLEYMALGSLYSYLHNPKHPQLDHAGYYQIAKDMALGMNYLHRHTPVVLHLDLKSMNVLLSTHLRAKIADFGFSKLRHDASQSAARSSKVHMAGTPAWMAPELLNTGDISTKSDVYSYSIILWEMLTRKHPYDGCSMFQVIERTRTNKRLDIPSHCPPGLRELITCCWSHNPAKRPSFKDILATLEKLQFPGEWRTLFAEAGIPESALNNIESSRTLIDIVSSTLEDVPGPPDNVPVLNLEESDEEIENKLLMDSDDDWDDVTGDDEDSEKGNRNAYRPHDVPRLNLNLSGDLAESKKLTATERTVTGVKQQQAVDAFEIDAQFQEKQAPAQMDTVPQCSVISGTNATQASNIPPPPPMMVAGAPDFLLTHTTNKQKYGVHDSFMKQLELALRDPQPRHNHNLRILSNEEDWPAEPQNSQAFGVKSSQLVSQKERLKPTDKPHPCQLRDLSKVPEETRKNLFDILKKAVNSRRLQLSDGKSVEQSISVDWSLED